MVGIIPVPTTLKTDTTKTAMIREVASILTRLAPTATFDHRRRCRPKARFRVDALASAKTNSSTNAIQEQHKGCSYKITSPPYIQSKVVLLPIGQWSRRGS